MRYVLYTLTAGILSYALATLYGLPELIYTIPVYVAGMIAMRISQVLVARKNPPRPPAVRRVACVCHTVPPADCRVGHCPEMTFRQT